MSGKDFQHLDDEALLEYYHSTRNLKAFRYLYGRHKDSLYRYCAQVNPGGSASVLEELWKKLLERPPKLYGRLLRNWLFIHLNKILRNHPDVETTAKNHRSDNQLLAAMQQLPRIERNILLLYLECRLPLSTVADIENISLKKCRAFYHSGSQRLQEILYGPAQRQPWRIEEASV